MSEQETITKESEEYLEATYKLQERSGVARTSDIANELKVSLGSVTNTIESLERRGLVEHHPYKGVRLTEKGMQYALNVIRKHRLAERLMTDLLDMKWSQVHENACQLEHALSQEILQSLEEKLGYPKTCPHGNPIPTKTHQIPEEQLISLTKLQPRRKAIIVQIREEKGEFLEKLEKMRILPGTVVQMKKKTDFKESVKVKVYGVSHILDFKQASKIFVKQIAGQGIRE